MFCDCQRKRWFILQQTNTQALPGAAGVAQGVNQGAEVTILLSGTHGWFGAGHAIAGVSDAGERLSPCLVPLGGGWVGPRERSLGHWG